MGTTHSIIPQQIDKPKIYNEYLVESFPQISCYKFGNFRYTETFKLPMKKSARNRRKKWIRLSKIKCKPKSRINVSRYCCFIFQNQFQFKEK